MNHRISFLFVALVLPAAAFILAAGDQCAVCGVQIQPDSRHFRTQDGGETYCERCFLSAPRCTRCKLPTAQEAIDPASGLCSRCLAKLPRCTACGRVITGTAYTIRFAAGQFCAECKQSRPACYVCGVPVENDHWKYPDGRHVCNQCGDRAVIDVAEIRKIMLDVEQTIQRRLGLVIAVPYELRVDKLADFRASHNGPGSSQTPSGELYGKELGMYRRIEGRSEIVLLFGLPPELTYEAAAHEYAHAWAAENCRPDLPPDLREGFAQWVAADVLRSKGFRGALEKLEARTDWPYGAGYRRVRSMQRARLWATILKDE